MIFLICLFVEIVAICFLILIEFTDKYKYNDWNIWVKRIVRVSMIVPLIGIIFTQPLTTLSIMMLVSFGIVILADLAIISNLLLGIGIFLGVHILNTTAFWMIAPQTQIADIITIIVLLGLAAILYFLIYFKNISFPLNLIIGIYITIITICLWRTVVWGNIFAILGVFLFFLSDAGVAYTEFIKKFPLYQQVNHLVYYGGLLGIALSCMK